MLDIAMYGPTHARSPFSLCRSTIRRLNCWRLQPGADLVPGADTLTGRFGQTAFPGGFVPVADEEGAVGFADLGIERAIDRCSLYRRITRDAAWDDC